MNWIARLFILIGVIMLGLAARDEHRGVAVVHVYEYGPPERATRAENPKRFRELMSWEWAEATICLLGGLVVLGIYRRLDRLDPLDPEFRATDALDDLDRNLDKEARQRHRPIK